MSKRFKTQDYHRYKKLGTRWRKPKGRHSKLRAGKSGSGIAVSIGHGTSKAIRGKIRKMECLIASSVNDLNGAKEAILISSTVGSKKAASIVEAAKQRGLKILNMKKVRRSERVFKELDVKRKMKDLEKREKKKTEEAEKKEKEAVNNEAGSEKKAKESRNKEAATEKKEKTKETSDENQTEKKI